MFLLRTLCLAAFAFAGSLVAEVVKITPPALTGAVQPQLAVAPGGKIHVVFGAHGTVYHASSPDGRAFSPPVKIATVEKLALGKRRGPRVVATDDLITVTAIAHGTGTLHGWTSADGGATWQDSGALNTVKTSAREGLHAMAADGQGLVALTWLDLRNEKMELWSRVSRDGGRSWGPETKAYASPEGPICPCCHPSVAIGPKGTIAVMWRNSLGGDRDMWMAVSSDGGKTFPNPQKLGTGSWRIAGCPMDGGSIAFQADGTPITAWRRETQVFTALPGKPEMRIAADAAQPVVLPTGTEVALAYEKGGKVMLRTGTRPAEALGAGRSPALAGNAKSAYVAWETDGGLLIAPIR